MRGVERTVVRGFVSEDRDFGKRVIGKLLGLTNVTILKSTIVYTKKQRISKEVMAERKNKSKNLRKAIIVYFLIIDNF